MTMTWFFIVVHLSACISVALAGEFLTCSSSQTGVKTGYIYDSSKKYADCPELIGSYIDWYQSDYRAECQRWMLGPEPERVGNAYISECHKYDNGTLRYRAEVCCEGVIEETRCFTCSNATDQYSCNYHGTIETCEVGQICSTVFNYYGSNGQYCRRYISKGCMAPATCTAMVEGNAAKCQRYVDDPRCAYCHEESFGNFVTSSSNTYLYCGKNPCTPNPCRWGLCVANDTYEAGYYCVCNNYAWADDNGICSYHMCQSNPCENKGVCYLSNSAPYYSCCCRTGYTGYNCSDDVEQTCSGYCLNGGTCYDYGLTGKRCVCPSGWVGERCETNSNITCKGGSAALYPVTTWSTSWSKHSNCSSYRFSESWFLRYCPQKMKRPDGPLFVNGVHGTVTKTEFNGLQTCEAGEKCFWTTAQACCPTCMSAPCLNGGWCIQKADDDYVCKCRFGYEGKHCENKVAVCVTSGDPHYATFDGAIYHFQGSCKYQMSAPNQQYPGLPYFKVLTKNEHRYGRTHVTYPRYLEVEVFGHTIRLDKGKMAYVDGVEVFPDVSYPGFKLTNNGNFLRLETNFSLVVEYDGHWIGLVKLPTEYSNKVGGLCANYDNDATNDLVTSAGEDVSSSPTMSSDIGNSWYVGDPTDPNCPIINQTDPTCDPNTKEKAEMTDYCGYIVDTAGPFGACVQADPTLAKNFFESCVYDTCVDFTKNTSCLSLEAFVTICRNKGYGPPSTWRETVRCPLACPTGMTYYASTSACHDTCKNPRGSVECALPDTEACKCPEGLVYHDRKCVNASICACALKQCPTGQVCKVDSSGVAQCGQTVTNGNWGSWSEWGDCSLPYSQGVQTRTRKCNNPAPSPNGQKCQGSNSESRKCVCKPFDAYDDCKKCDETNNPSGYLPDPCSCNHYYQCYKRNGLWAGASQRPCPACTCWDQRVLTCVRDPSVVDTSICPVDPAEQEEVFTDGVECTRGANTYRSVANEPALYDWLVFGTWNQMQCAPGTAFDIDQCQCVFGNIQVAPAVKKAFCLSFDEGWNGFSTDTGIWVQPVDVERVQGGVSGYAAKFNGITSLIEIPYFNNNQFAAFTFSLWFKRNANSAGVQGLVYNGDCDEEGSIQITSEGASSVGAGIWADDDLRKAFEGLQASDNVWHHAVLTYDGRKVKFYLDNVLVQNRPTTSGKTLPNNCPLVLGYRYLNGYFSGLMDEVCFYTEALSAAAVADLYAAGSAPSAT